MKKRAKKYGLDWSRAEGAYEHDHECDCDDPDQCSCDDDGCDCGHHHGHHGGSSNYISFSSN